MDGHEIPEGPVATQQSQESFIDAYHVLRALCTSTSIQLAPLVGAENVTSVSRTS